MPKLLQIKLITLFIFGLVSIDSKADAKPKYWRATWWSDPSSTMVLGWYQPEQGAAVLSYGERSLDAPQSYPHKLTVNTPEKGKTYFAQLSGLKPDTEYSFKVKTKTGSSRKLWFRTMPNQAQRLKVIAGGDSRNHRKVRRAANLTVAEIQPDFVLFGGDFTASDSKKQWKKWFEDWQLSIAEHGRLIPLIPARGNHDSEKQLGRAWGRAHPHFYYAINFAGNLLRVYTLNSERPAGGNQKAWLNDDLQKHSDSILKFVHYHKPMRPHVRGKSEGQDEYLNWASLFAKHKVDLAIECDSHMMKMTKALWPSQDGQDGFDSVYRGTTYIGEGGWGAPLRSVNDHKSWTMFYGRVNHFFFIEVEKNGVYRISPIMINATSKSSQDLQQEPLGIAPGVKLPSELQNLSIAIPLKVPQPGQYDESRPTENKIEFGYSPRLLTPLNTTVKTSSAKE